RKRLQTLQNTLRNRQSISPWGLIHCENGRGLPVKTPTETVNFCTEFDTRHITYAYQCSVLSLPQDNAAELLRRFETSSCADCILHFLTPLRRGCTNLARSYHSILFFTSLDKVRGRQTTACEALRIQPNAHSIGEI